MPLHFVVAYAALTIGCVGLNCALVVRKLRLRGSLAPSAPLPPALAALFTRYLVEAVLYGAASCAFAHLRPRLWSALGARLAAAGSGRRVGSGSGCSGSSSSSGSSAPAGVAADTPGATGAAGAGSSCAASQGGGRVVEGSGADSEGLERQQGWLEGGGAAGAAADAVAASSRQSSSDIQRNEPDVSRDGIATDGAGSGRCEAVEPRLQHERRAKHPSCGGGAATAATAAAAASTATAAAAGATVGSCLASAEACGQAGGPPTSEAAPAPGAAAISASGGSEACAAAASSVCGAAAAVAAPAPLAAAAAAAPAMTALAAARALVAGRGAGGYGPAAEYVPHMSLRRVVIRLPDLGPGDLPQGWADSLRELLAARHPDWQLLNVGVRQGSLILVLEMLLPAPPLLLPPPLPQLQAQGPAKADTAAMAATGQEDILSALGPALAPLLAENERRRQLKEKVQQQQQQQQQEEEEEAQAQEEEEEEEEVEQQWVRRHPATGLEVPARHRGGVGAATSALVEGSAGQGAFQLHVWDSRTQSWQQRAAALALAAAAAAPPLPSRWQEGQPQSMPLGGCGSGSGSGFGAIARVAVWEYQSPRGVATERVTTPTLQVSAAVAPAALQAALGALGGLAAHGTAAPGPNAEDFSLWLRFGVPALPTSAPGVATAGMASAAAATAACDGRRLLLPALPYCRAHQPLQRGAPPDADASAAAGCGDIAATAAGLMQLSASISPAELAAMLQPLSPLLRQDGGPVLLPRLALYVELWHNPSGLLCGSASLPLLEYVAVKAVPWQAAATEACTAAQAGTAWAAAAAAAVQLESCAGLGTYVVAEAEAVVGDLQLQHALTEAGHGKCSDRCASVVSSGCDAAAAAAAAAARGCCLSPAA
ncbi:hypothetical protein HYH02_008167 [Chlamydomonas schloesseri]|uniref:Uncharacterized protein n=1 Tax=Chlamydomonas schloesseri TaxID=2026947 RepID=A0A835WG78_9CHLO|nr:hypothetical protein HYH02_008167 [Chlamydomonas schloesseri]|eukprot:KAG2447014.1 hypothetical protein HYH02_008167 [Chlamydomonas schloesseri]